MSKNNQPDLTYEFKAVNTATGVIVTTASNSVFIKGEMWDIENEKFIEADENHDLRDPEASKRRQEAYDNFEV